jgi:hypothetical protein
MRPASIAVGATSALETSTEGVARADGASLKLNCELDKANGPSRPARQPGEWLVYAVANSSGSSGVAAFAVGRELTARPLKFPSGQPHADRPTIAGWLKVGTVTDAGAASSRSIDVLPDKSAADDAPGDNSTVAADGTSTVSAVDSSAGVSSAA